MEFNFSDQFAALGHPQRLAVLRLLMRRYPDVVPAGDLAQALALPPSTLSAYLSTLTQAGLVSQTRAGRSLLYGVRIEAMQDLLGYLALDCCRGRPEVCWPKAPRPSERPHVLFICTGNSARSIMAEALLRDLGGGDFIAHSAGTRPFSTLNPEAVALLLAKGHDTSGLRAKHISEFRAAGAPRMDYVFTVCDRAAHEECPAWPGQPVSGHFSTPDPVAVQGDDATRALAFQQAYGGLHNRISLFISRHRAAETRAERQDLADAAARLKG